MSGPAAELVDAAARALLLAAAVAAALALLRVRGGEPRLRIWRWVLYAALAMPLLLALEPRWQLRLPLLPPTPAPVTTKTAAGLTAAAPLPPVHPVVVSVPAAAPLPAPPLRRALSLSFAEVIYLLVAGALLLRLALGWTGSRRALRTAAPVEDAALLRDATAAAAELGINHQPRLLESPLLVVPATLGVWRPAVVLPAAWPAWTAEKRRAVLLHELAHVARRDALIQRLSLLHRALFWFSPLGWWLHRALQDLAEQASDEAVLRAGAGREGYAQVLLDFLRELRAARRPEAREGVAMARGARAERRIDRILTWQGGVSMKTSNMRNLGLALAVGSLALLAAAARPVMTARTLPPPQALSSFPTAALAPAAARSTAASASKPAVASAPTRTVSAPQVAESLGRDITVIVGTGAENLRRSQGSGSGCDDYGYDSDGQTLVAIGDCTPRTPPSADVKWWARIGSASIDFEQDGKTSHITDLALVRRARQLFLPMLQLEQQQAALGNRQADLGRQQASLGRQQAQLSNSQAMASVKVDLPQLLASLKSLESSVEQLHSSATQVELSDLQSRLASVQARLARLQTISGQSQALLAEQQAEFGNQQAQLGALQSELGAQQTDLGAQSQVQARNAVSRLHALLSGSAH